MSEKQPDNVRARDDWHLRQLVAETRQWMQAEGIEERELDWQAIARAEQARWWKARLRQALRELAARAGVLAESAAVRLRQLAPGPDTRQLLSQRLTAWQDQVEHGAIAAEAAVQALLVARHAGAVDVLAALSHPTVEFAAAGAGLWDERSEANAAEQAPSAVVVTTDALPGARVAIEEDAIVVTFLDWQAPSPPLVVLVPDDDQQAPRLPDLVESQADAWTVRFERIPPASYLLAVAPFRA